MKMRYSLWRWSLGAAAALMAYVETTTAFAVAVPMPGSVLIDTSASAGSVASQSTYLNGYSAANAFDGLWSAHTNRWLALVSNNPMYFVYEFKTATKVNVLRLRIPNDWNWSTRAPKDWTFSGSNDNVAWNTLDTRSDVTWTEGEVRDFSFTNETSYKYYKFSCTANNGAEDYMQLWEVQFVYDDGSGIVLTDLTTSTSGSVSSNSELYNSGYPAANAFDGKIDSAGRWLAKIADHMFLVYHFNTATNVNAMRIRSGEPNTGGMNYKERAPKAWTFSGSNDGSTWTTLDTQTDETNWSSGGFRYYQFHNKDAYAYYKYDCTELCTELNDGTDCLQIWELEFYNVPYGLPSLDDVTLARTGVATYSLTAEEDVNAADISYILSDGETVSTNGTRSVAEGGTETWTIAGLTADKTYAISVLATNENGTVEADAGTLYTGVLSLGATTDANEKGLVAGGVTVSRVNDDSLPLTVNYTISGSAGTEGTTWEVPVAVTIPANAASAVLPVVPLDDVTVDEDVTITVTLLAGNYEMPGTTTATLTLRNRVPVEETDFVKKMTLTPSATALAKIGEGTFANFPVLVRLPAEVSGELRSANGTDLFFKDENNASLQFEVDTFNPAGETLVWVRVPSLSSATELTVCFGGYANADNDPTAVWTDYAGVWHMNEASGAVADATGHRLSASPATWAGVSVAYSEGAVGTARQTATSDKKDYLTIPSYDSLGVGGTFTFSCWYDATARKGYDRLVSRKVGHGDANGWEVEMANSSTTMAPRGASGTFVSATIRDLVSSGWLRLTFVYSGSSLKAYCNGAQVGSGSIAAATDNGKPLSIGCDSDGNEAYFVGYVDEARLRKGALTPAEVALEHATMADAAFFDVGDIELTDPTAQKFATPTAVRNGNGSYTVSVVLTENNGDVGVIYDAGSAAITNIIQAATSPGTFTDTPANLAADTTYKFSAYGKNANDVEVVKKGGVFYNGDISIEKISDANENGLITGVFRISRADTAHDLTVTYTVGGTAVAGQTYEALSGTATIPAGMNSVDIALAPLLDSQTTSNTTVTVTLDSGLYGIDAQAGSAEMAVLNLVAPSGYNTWVATADGLASEGSNWSAGVAPTASDNVLFDGRFSTANCEWDSAASATVASWTQNADYTGTVEIQTTYASGAFPLLSIAGDCVVNGGKWTHASNTNVANNASAQYRLNVSVGGDFTLGSGAKIDLIGRGYNVGRCPYGSQVGVHAATGRGTYSAIYGNVYAPEDIGSGGENNNKNTSAGGGAVKLAVKGAAVIDGTIAANACSQKLNGNNPEKGYGAGGSVFITAGSISGSGTVDVSARPNGISETAYTGYPGSGGRMALVATSGEVSIPFAKLRADGSLGSYSAGAGTIFVKNSTDANGSLLVGNNAVSWSYVVRYVRKDGCTCVKPGETWTFDHVYVRDSGILSVPANATLSLPGGFESVSSLTDSSSPLCGIMYLGGTITLPAREEHVLSGAWMFMGAEPYTFNGDVRLTSKASIGSFQLYADSVAAYPACTVTVTGDMTVESGTSLYAHNRGRRGADTNAMSYHGGSVASKSDHLKVYDSILSPRLGGEGARNGDMGNTNPGGGAIVLTVRGALTLNGSANAGTSKATDYHFGAAGTINITAGSIAGSGSITANGVASNGKSRGAGAGGRVAVRLTDAGATFADYSGTITAQGNNGNSATVEYGTSAGTVYLQDGDTAEGAGTIKVANLSGCTATGAKTGFPSLSNGEPIDDLTKANLEISNNSTVILIADVKMSGLEIASGSKLDLNGKKLTVKSAKVNGVKLASGTYAAGDEAVSGFVVDSATSGSLVVTGGGFSIIVR